MIFVDTSGLYAILDRADASHAQAREQWRRMIEGGASLLTTNYVLVEASALIQRRLGIEAVRDLHFNLVAALEVIWIDQKIHATAMAALLAASRRKLSLVDCSSFIVMREAGITTALAFDTHFAEEGFDSY